MLIWNEKGQMHGCTSHLMFLYCSWRTVDFESCWESVVKRSWSWREKMRQRARRCRRCWPAPTSAYERVRAQTDCPPPPSDCCHYCVQCVQSVATYHFTSHPTDSSNDLPPNCIFSMMLQSCILSGDSDTSSVHTHFSFCLFFLLVLLLCLLSLPACMSLWCLQGFKVWMSKRRAWVKINV